MSGIVSRLSVLGKVWLGLAAGALACIPALPHQAAACFSRW